ncbi:UNKNOWN [Stylonychia lemnae]|uniref:Uncharacterized protein n=1 Tax=Stylonychia lemnae TaxID=5949 RepID=A0A078A7C9_STYLE|nr:UNKNOWN [Stylonychia lemnae]|eukprot:CDW77781.1 UNKNOWN [Stylonychia lemnae]
MFKRSKSHQRINIQNIKSASNKQKQSINNPPQVQSIQSKQIIINSNDQMTLKYQIEKKIISIVKNGELEEIIDLLFDENYRFAKDQVIYLSDLIQRNLKMNQRNQMIVKALNQCLKMPEKMIDTESPYIDCSEEQTPQLSFRKREDQQLGLRIDDLQNSIQLSQKKVHRSLQIMSQIGVIKNDQQLKDDYLEKIIFERQKTNLNKQIAQELIIQKKEQVKASKGNFVLILKDYQVSLFEPCLNHKCDVFANQMDNYFNFTDKYGWLYRYFYTEKKLIRVPHIQLLNHGFIQMDTNVEFVVGLNSDYQVKFLYPNSQNNSHALGYELSINKYLKRTRIQKISCGSHHTLMLSFEGKLISQGSGEFGQLGTETTNQTFYLPQFPLFFKMLHLSDIAAFRESSMVLTVEGLVFTFGCGFEGQIGNGKLDNQKVPYCLQNSPFLINQRAKKIKASDYTGSLITLNNELYVWGLYQIVDNDEASPAKIWFNDQKYFQECLQVYPKNITSLIEKQSGQIDIFKRLIDYEINDEMLFIAVNQNI